MDQNRLVRITQRALCFAGRNSAYNTTDCGAPPIPKPTRPLSMRSHTKIGARALNAPK